VTQTAAEPEMTWGDMLVLLNFASYSPLTAHASRGSSDSDGLTGIGATPGRPPGFTICKTSEAVCAQEAIDEWSAARLRFRGGYRGA
jgi:hypothetical protein